MPPAAKPKAAGGSVLKKKVGPLPLYGWLIAGIAVYLGYRYFKGSSTAATTTTTPATDGQSGALATPTDTSGAAGGASGSADTTSGQGDATQALLNSLLAGEQVLSDQIASGYTPYLSPSATPTTTSGFQSTSNAGALTTVTPNAYPQYGIIGTEEGPAVGTPSSSQLAAQAAGQSYLSTVGPLGVDVTAAPAPVKLAPVPNLTPATYGITYGPTAGKRMSAGTIH